MGAPAFWMRDTQIVLNTTTETEMPNPITGSTTLPAGTWSTDAADLFPKFQHFSWKGRYWSTNPAGTLTLRVYLDTTECINLPVTLPDSVDGQAVDIDCYLHNTNYGASGQLQGLLRWTASDSTGVVSIVSTTDTNFGRTFDFTAANVFKFTVQFGTQHADNRLYLTDYSVFDSPLLGPQGESGIQGAQGPQGNIGYQGSQGAQGFQGLEGGQGAQGAQGPQGLVGGQGTQGSQGAQGNQGQNGNLGNRGYQGYTGFQGAQGTQGTQGNQGAQGIQGWQGTNPGPQGAQGAQGWQGPVQNPTHWQDSSAVEITITDDGAYHDILSINMASATRIFVWGEVAWTCPSGGYPRFILSYGAVPTDVVASETNAWSADLTSGTANVMCYLDMSAGWVILRGKCTAVAGDFKVQARTLQILKVL